jgi:RNAse (barnase) inhibitor barstar
MGEDWFDASFALPRLRGTSAHVLPADRLDEVRAALAAAGFRVGEIEGEKVKDEASFFREAAAAFGWTGSFGRNWDAVHDALGDLGSARARRVALIWRDADHSLGRDPQTVVDALVALTRAADDLGGEDPPTQLEVFLFQGGTRRKGGGAGRKRRG